MEKYIPKEKLSKKRQKALNQAKRTTWAISPVTRRPQNPKAYNRKKVRRYEGHSPNAEPFLFY